MENYLRRHRLTIQKIMNAKVKCAKSVIQTLREKGLEGDRKWYRFLRAQNMCLAENVESLKVNGEVIPDKEKMRESIKDFLKRNISK